MKTKTLITLMVLFSLKGFAQYSPIGAEWYFRTSDPLGRAVYSYYKYTCISDTIINGDHYSKIYYSDAKGNNKFNVSYYLTQQNGKIYYWFKNAKKTLFDLNAKLGDTLNLDLCYTYFTQYGISTDTSYNLNTKVTGISWLKNYLNATDSLKTFNITISPNQAKSGNAIFTERVINSNIKMQYSILNIIAGPIFEGSNIFSCYQDSVYGFKTMFAGSQGQACDYSNVGVDEVYYKEGVIIYPNPVLDNLNIDLKNLPEQSSSIKINIIDILGREMYSAIYIANDKDARLTIPINLVSGTYFIKLDSEQIHENKRFNIIK